MDCNITKNNIYSCKTVYENFSEEKVDLDIVIPDYCAAAVRILKCEVQPVINSKTVDGDRLILEGVCTVNVIYADEQTGAVKSIIESTTFSQTQQLKEQLSILQGEGKKKQYTINPTLYTFYKNNVQKNRISRSSRLLRGEL